MVDRWDEVLRSLDERVREGGFGCTAPKTNLQDFGFEKQSAGGGAYLLRRRIGGSGQVC